MLGKYIKGSSRSVKAQKNILASVLFRGADTLVYLLLVPLTLGYLNPYEYGIWLTLNSMLEWINSFDIGLGNGLRNKLATALAEGDKAKARIYVSTTFYALIATIVILYALLAISVEYIDWYSVLNVTKGSVGNLKMIIHVSMFFFCINFVLKIVGNVFQALQLPAVNSMITFSGHFLSLIVIYLFTIFVIPGTLFWVALIYSASPTLIYLIAYPLTFHSFYSYLSPSTKLFKKEYLKDLMSLSVVFFVLQISSVVLFAMSNLVIANLFGPDQVTPYNIAYRYFSLIPMVFVIIITPMWSAATDAYAKNDMEWIKRSNHIIVLLLFVFGGMLLTMILCSGIVYHIWIGEKVFIPLGVSIATAIYVLIYIWSLSFSYFLNGIGRLRLQMIITLGAAICFYPICFLFGNHLGLIGIPIGMCVINLPGAIVNTIQFRKVVNKTDAGIWNK